MNHVLVTGATGAAIGPRVVHALYQAGYQIRTLSSDAFLRQCLKLRSHYTTGSEMILVKN